jgi:hypothetical protein
MASECNVSLLPVEHKNIGLKEPEKYNYFDRN